MDVRDSTRASACRVELVGVPGCDSGPAGRLAFVTRELVAAVRRRRTHQTGRTR